ncbi:TPA: 3-hydroxyacyl-CoA dehydrogenase NAD-binding domain-containing protein [Burkholderia cepacia]|uniref:3-hydroxyacyl-CoA dehydrogenase NAD-binding domain-containing protein n=1 Tax=Burkholderia cepacia TaxID=292 RepID=UPI001CF57EAF|nr:3-hydroxyacyl-CoA dehydrogenase NAD-binding domain-containing protein [Burkholderia cepacia]MCA8357591.1 enoyl-CoA hydratase/isomerase family protein [Burkholderia cepacia]
MQRHITDGLLETMLIELTHPFPGVAVFTLAHPPVNALSTPLRQALLAALRAAEADESVEAVVLAGNSRAFCAGADLKEFNEGTAFGYPSLTEVLVPFILAMSKPVVAAIEGCALGGGLELALWCHARVATHDAPLGLTETTLGLMPGAGGNQLLPRAIGLERALNLIVSGRVEPAKNFDGTALVDALSTRETLIEVAAGLGLRIARIGRPFPHLSARVVTHPEPAGFLAFAMAQARSRKDANRGMLVAIDALALSLKLPVLDGLKKEFALFTDVMQGEQAAAIRHAFFAQRESTKVLDLNPEAKAQPIKRAAVIGAGFMGSGIAHCLNRAGIEVFLHDANTDLAQSAVETLRSNADVDSTRLDVLPALSDLAEVDLVVEAVVESMEVKIEVFRMVDQHLKHGAILATNTSMLNIDQLAAATSRAQDVIGLHFFGPAPVMRLLEVVRAARTSDSTLATAMSLARQIKKVPVVAKVSPGFIGNRIFNRFLEAALELMARGVRPDHVDCALEKTGMRMGPFRTMDLIGNDILAKALDSHGAGVGQLHRLAAQKRFGVKTRLGWYRYDESGRQAKVDPDLEASLPLAQIADPAEIADQCLLALINEGARVLEEGVAQRASDIDVTFLLGYGFPRDLGGPMRYADRSGLAVIEQKLLDLKRRTGRACWEPAALIRRLAGEGRTFNAL